MTNAMSENFQGNCLFMAMRPELIRGNSGVVTFLNDRGHGALEDFHLDVVGDFDDEAFFLHVGDDAKDPAGHQHFVAGFDVAEQVQPEQE